jgi:hypothetical protein
MGYLVCRLMATYGMAYHLVMGLPMRVFWHLSGYVERIRKEQCRLHIDALVATQNEEALKNMLDHLDSVAPEPIEMSPEAIARARHKAPSQLDSEGLNELKSLS